MEPGRPTNLSLLTDLYELTMACGYWKSGRADDEAVFHLFFREAPFGGTYALAAGLADALAFLEGFRFEPGDLDYLASLEGADGAPLFERAFVDHLAAVRFEGDVDAVPEGTVVFPREPLLRVRGSLLSAQLVETALLNLINFQTLIATKASRVCRAAAGAPVIEFGARRAQGPDGALSASRAAYLGGCAATSNVLAGRLYGIPLRGTHAHSWVQCFESELEAFETYAEALPSGCILLVDTYATGPGVDHAVEVARGLRARGHELAGIRLDSGELGPLARMARARLDEAGFEEAIIVGSGDLDEHLIDRLVREGAPIGAWGVGTRLAAGWDQPALGGVYKLAALRRRGRGWRYTMKLSEEAAKSTLPGVLQVRRFERDGRFVGDLLYDEQQGSAPEPELLETAGGARLARFGADASHEDLLGPALRAGRRVAADPPLAGVRERAAGQLDRLPAEVTALEGATPYPVGIDRALLGLVKELAPRVGSA